MSHVSQTTTSLNTLDRASPQNTHQFVSAFLNEMSHVTHMYESRLPHMTASFTTLDGASPQNTSICLLILL